ncbi:MAG: glycogen debranching enzyme family protein [Phycisphaerales bacterium]|nr:glycogen debranching enzyme family protein [Phycisphaerales bacterium]
MSVTAEQRAPSDSARVLSYDGDVDAFSGIEWLLTNKRGGFAMGSALGLNTRRYHGLLIAATQPPVGRIMLLNGLIERIAIQTGRSAETVAEISNHRFTDGTIHPQGHTYLKRFEIDHACRWVYQIGDVEITRELYLFDDRDECAISYHVKSPGRTVRIRIAPLVSVRDFHELLRDTTDDRFGFVPGPKQIMLCTDACELCIGSEQAIFVPDEDWWHQFHYAREAERGLADSESLFTPGCFEYTFDPRTSKHPLTIYAGVGSDLVRPIEESIAQHQGHIAAITDHVRASGVTAEPVLRLARASDAYVVGRRVDGVLSTSILAGFPWFADWGRDTMICLPGLLLTTGRWGEALQTLSTFGRHVQRGLIPNRFDDYGGRPHYNTVDASLWYIHAASQYLAMSKDFDGFAEHALPACLEIIEHYRRGTDLGIGMDEGDKLIFAGDANTQLTWMDAKRDGTVFTPRHGKAVEINALWHHALLAVSEAVTSHDAALSASLRMLAGEVAASFRQAFWNDDTRCLYDVLTADSAYEDGWRPVPDIRPNQLLAVSLPHSPLRIAQQRAVVDVCREHLLTPMGLRTLSPTDPAYQPRFEGDMFARDAAYHQGTCWPWLIGPFVEAFLRSEGFTENARRQAREFISPLLAQLDSQCLGQIAEVYDGGDPAAADLDQRPQGCIAQAWSVAELLRIAILIERGPIG